MRGIVYKYTNKINGKVYIGQTIHEKHRMEFHRGCYSESYFHTAIKKYGWENFEYTILYELDYPDREVVHYFLDMVEMDCIQLYDACDATKGYNKALGGKGSSGYKLTTTQRQKISDKMRGRIMDSEWRAKIGRTRIERAIPAPNKGKTLSMDTRLKIRKNSANSKPFYVDGVEYASLCEACRVFGWNANNVQPNKCKTYKGHKINR